MRKRKFLIIETLVIILAAFFFGGLLVREADAYIEPTVIYSGINDPRDLVINNNGDIFYVDYEMGNLAMLRGGTTQIPLMYNLQDPAGLAFDSNWNLYYTERGAGTLKRITASALDGSHAISPGEITTILTGLSNPADVTASSTKVYFAENIEVGTIKYYDTADGQVYTVLTGIKYPWSVAVRSDGMVVYSELGKNRIQYLEVGETVPKIINSYGPVYGVAFDADDNCFFTLGIGNTNFGILGEVFADSKAGTGIYATEGNMRVPDVYEGYVYWGEQAGYPNGRILKIPIPETSYAQIINGNDGGTIETDFGDVLTVPAGAYASNETITIDIKSVPETLNPTDIIIPRTYTFGPSPLNFSPSISMVFHYTKADLKGHAASELHVYYWDKTIADWVYIAGTVDEAAHTLTVPIDHFSTYGVFAAESEGGIGPPETPARPIRHIEWLPPLSNAVITAGQTLPIRFALADAEGNFIADETMEVGLRDDEGNFTGWFNTTKVRGSDSYVQIQGGKYHLNLQTKDYSWITGGELYTLEVKFDDVRPFALKFPIKAKHGSGNPIGFPELFGGIAVFAIGFLAKSFLVKRKKA